VASRVATWDEVARLVGVMGELDAGVFQLGPDISSGERHRATLVQVTAIARDSGRPAMFGILSTRQGIEPELWESQLRYLDEAAASGARLVGRPLSAPSTPSSPSSPTCPSTCESFYQALGEQGTSLPAFVHAEFERYLRCGRLQHGFVRVKCSDCRHEHLLAFSC
jgi:hypothetical protein